MRHTLASITFAVLTLATPAASAADNLWLSFGTLSHHFNREKDYRESHPTLGLTLKRESSNWHPIGGYYRNSLDKHSFYAGAIYRPQKWPCGVILDVVTGYDLALTPRLVPTCGIEYRRFGVDLLAIPKIPNVTSGLVAVSFRVRLGN